MCVTARKVFFSALSLAFCVLLFVSAVPVFASAGVFGSSGGADGALEFELEGGVRVTFKEVKEIKANTYNRIGVIVTFVSAKDQIIKVSSDGCVAFDDQGNRFEIYFFASKPGIWIGNERVTERMVIRDVPTDVTFAFGESRVPLAKSFARIDLNLMGTMVTLRNVPSTK